MNDRLTLLCFMLFFGMSGLACFAEEAPLKPIHAVSLPQAHKGTLEIDSLLLDSFGRLSESRRNFYLTARGILVDSHAATPSDPGIIEAAKMAGLPMISGPMLGGLSDSGVTVWFRPVDVGELTIQVTSEDEEETKEFSANMPVYASWDDHDYLNNDKSGLQKGKITDHERNALRHLWVDNWNNPPTKVKDRGVYFNAVIGDIEIIMLDTRSCREWSKRGQQGSYLGDAQMQWLLKTLKTSRAKFIILTSGTMWSDFMSKAKDSWGTWDMPGREEIFDLIEKNQIGGVLLLSGDRHGARGFRIGRPSGFTLYEFEVATLGGVGGPDAFAPDGSSQMFGYKGGLKAFGEFTFDMAKPDPEVTFCLINEEGKELEKRIFPRSLLTPRKE